MAPLVLTIEDDPAIRRGIVDALTFAGYRTLEAADVSSGGRLAVEACYDLLLLDLVLPDGDGLEILARVRAAQPTVPVIVLTARGDESDRVAGLKQGADDYVVKPFSVRELLARIEAVLRRSPSRPLDVQRIRLPAGTVDLARREVRFDDGQRSELSEREAELLRYLARHRQRAIGRDELLANVWRLDPQGLATRTIDMHVARLREKLRDDPAHPQVLVTVRGKGYMLALAAEAMAREVRAAELMAAQTTALEATTREAMAAEPRAAQPRAAQARAAQARAEPTAAEPTARDARAADLRAADPRAAEARVAEARAAEPSAAEARAGKGPNSRSRSR